MAAGKLKISAVLDDVTGGGFWELTEESRGAICVIFQSEKKADVERVMKREMESRELDYLVSLIKEDARFADEKETPLLIAALKKARSEFFAAIGEPSTDGN